MSTTVALLRGVKSSQRLSFTKAAAELFVTQPAVTKHIKELEQQLSLYRDDSDIYDLNFNAWKGPIPVDPRVFRLLRRAQELSAFSGGALDITVAPLVRAWGFMGASGSPPDFIANFRAGQGTRSRVVVMTSRGRAIEGWFRLSSWRMVHHKAVE